MKWKTILPVLILSTILVTQAVKYGSHVASVNRTLTAQLWTYHDHGEEAYREAVLVQLEKMGMDREALELETIEDLPHDEFRVGLRYDWPLHVLVFTFQRPQEEHTQTPILDR